MTKEYLYKRSFNQGVSNSYSEIRKRGCCGKRKNFRVVLKTNILKLMIKIKKLLGIEISIWNIRSSGNIDGYIFHSTKVASNPQLLNWVLKPSYFESNLPKNIELLKEGFNGN